MKMDRFRVAGILLAFGLIGLAVAAKNPVNIPLVAIFASLAAIGIIMFCPAFVRRTRRMNGGIKTS